MHFLKHRFPLLLAALTIMLLLALLDSGCTQMRYAQTNMVKAVKSTVVQQHHWGEVICGDGRVCAEVEVTKLDVEARAGGRVDVTFLNRTGSQVSVQVKLEIIDANGRLLDQSPYEDVALQPRDSKVWSMPGIYKPHAKVKVHLRAQ